MKGGDKMHNIIDLQNSDIAMNDEVAHHSGASLFACHCDDVFTKMAWAVIFALMTARTTVM